MGKREEKLQQQRVKEFKENQLNIKKKIGSAVKQTIVLNKLKQRR